MYCHWLTKNNGGALCARSALELRGLVYVKYSSTIRNFPEVARLKKKRRSVCKFPKLYIYFSSEEVQVIELVVK